MPQEDRLDTGSHASSEPAFLILGKLRRAHGTLGEIPLELHTKMLELLSAGNIVYIGENHKPYTIEKTRWKQPFLLIKFEEISDRTAASQLTNQLLYIKTTQLEPLPIGEFYYHELIGLNVLEDDGRFLGVLEEILETGANDVYLIRNSTGKETLIPATKDMVQNIDLKKGKMIVSKMEWYGEGN
ncbi:MAG: ribosome maturation factor RimM [Chloroflexota bacterium]|nr:ribosome maturation factor RimM [Chloroflexota bacterium]